MTGSMNNGILYFVVKLALYVVPPIQLYVSTDQYMILNYVDDACLCIYTFRYLYFLYLHMILIVCE